MPRLPISLFFLLALVVLLGLQAIPIVGVVLMLFGSMFIAGFAVHAFLIGLAVEALTGRVSRGLIAIPLLAYGGYYLMYAAQRYEIAHKSAQMRATNPGKIFDFNPDLHSLVIKEAVPFINAHAVPVAYETNPNFQPEGHQAYRLIPRAQCDDIKRDTQARIFTYGVHHDGVFQRQVCQLVMPQAPEHAVVAAIRRGDLDFWKRTREIMEQTTDLVFDGKVVGSYRTASVWRLPAFPVLVITCGLGPSCYDFWRSWESIDAVPEGIDQTKYDTPVSIMLGLRTYTAADLADFRGFPQNTPALASAAAEPARVEDKVFAVLQQILAGQDVTLPHEMGYSIATNPQRLAPFADAMVKRLAELLAARPNQMNRDVAARALATGIAALPRAAFTGIADQVFELIQDAKVADRFPMLFLRAADAGPRTFEFYKSAILASRDKRVLNPVLALAVCRIGHADAETVAELKRRFVDEHQDNAALLVALVKVGEEAFVRENLKLFQKRAAQWANAVLAGEGTTDVGPNNCMGERWGFIDYLSPDLRPALEWGHAGWKSRAAM